MTENDIPQRGSGVTPSTKVVNDLYVKVAVDGQVPKNIHAKDDVTIDIFGGTRDKPLFIGKVLIKKNGGKYVCTLNFDRVYPVHKEKDTDEGAEQ